MRKKAGRPKPPCLVGLFELRKLGKPYAFANTGVTAAVSFSPVRMR